MIINLAKPKNYVKPDRASYLRGSVSPPGGLPDQPTILPEDLSWERVPSAPGPSPNWDSPSPQPEGPWAKEGEGLLTGERIPSCVKMRL